MEGTLPLCHGHWLCISSTQQSIQVVQPLLILRGRNALYVKSTPLVSFPLMIMHEILHHLLHLQVFIFDVLNTIYKVFYIVRNGTQTVISYGGNAGYSEIRLPK
ncbi:hypothetical protein VPH35_013603 [Triticum aestivum]